MATAAKTTEVTTTTIIQLNLSQEEAQSIRNVLGHTNGGVLQNLHLGSVWESLGPHTEYMVEQKYSIKQDK